MAGFSIGSVVAKIRADVSDFKDKMSEVQQSAKQMGEKLESVGRSMSLRLTAPIVGAGIAIAKTASDFESSLSKIVGLVGISQKQVNAWRDDILDLSIAMGKSPNELADAMFFVTSAGLRGKEALDVLKISAKAAASGLGETKIIADLVTSAVNAYGIKNLSAAKAADILTATVREGKAEPAELAASMGFVLPIASQMGISFDQVGAAMAGMTRTGTNASTSATQLRQIMVSLLKPAKQAQDTLAEYGLSAAGLRKEIKQKGLISALQTLTTAIGDNDDAQAKIFGNVRALAGVMDLLGDNSESNIAIFKALDKSAGSLDDAFDAAANTAGFKMNQAMASLKVTLIGLGDTVLPLVASGANKLVEVFRIMRGIFDSIPEPIRTTTVVLLGILAVIGPLLIVIGSLIKLIGVATIAVKGLAAVLILLIGPVGLVIGVVAALTAGIIFLATQTDIFKTKQDLERDAHKQLTSAIDENKDAVKNLDDALEGVTDASHRLEGAQLAVDRATRNLTEVTKIYGEHSLEAKEARHQLKGAENNVRDAMADVNKKMDEAEEKHKLAIETSRDVVKAQDNVTEKVNTHATAWENLSSKIGSVIGKIGEYISKAQLNNFNPLGLNIPGLAQGVRNFAGGLAVVGEMGPELVRLPAGSDVFSNGSMGGSVGGTSVIVNLDGAFIGDMSQATRLAEKIGDGIMKKLQRNIRF